MTRLKDQIRLAKKAIKEAKKKPHLYTEEEIAYMAIQLTRAKIALTLNLRAGGGFEFKLFPIVTPSMLVL